jgi:hypothetical protein
MDRPLVFTNQCFKTKKNNLSIAKVTEVIESSTKSFDDALEIGIARIQAPLGHQRRVDCGSKSCRDRWQNQRLPRCDEKHILAGKLIKTART